MSFCHVFKLALTSRAWRRCELVPRRFKTLDYKYSTFIYYNESLSTVGQAVVMSRDKLSICFAGCPFGRSGLWWLCGFFAELVSGDFCDSVWRACLTCLFDVTFAILFGVLV